MASAMALHASRGGLRTLLLEVNAPDDAAHCLGVRAAVDEPKEVLPNLWLCRMTPEGALREYALMVLKFRALHNLVLENRVVKYLLRSIPSLGEFNMFGKAWFHATELLDDGTPRYERVFVDAPSTGHALTFLSAARTVADLAPQGTMKEASERMALLLEADSSCLHVVSLAEEMPVNEALELIRSARERLHIAPGLLFVNRVIEPWATKEERALLEQAEKEAEAQAGLQAYAEVLRFCRNRELVARQSVLRLRNEGGWPMVLVPERRSLEDVVSVLAQASSDGPSAEAARSLGRGSLGEGNDG